MADENEVFDMIHRFSDLIGDQKCKTVSDYLDYVSKESLAVDSSSSLESADAEEEKQPRFGKNESSISSRPVQA